MKAASVGGFFHLVRPLAIPFAARLAKWFACPTRLNLYTYTCRAMNTRAPSNTDAPIAQPAKDLN
jgi:hypothetical protein